MVLTALSLSLIHILIVPAFAFDDFVVLSAHKCLYFVSQVAIVWAHYESLRATIQSLFGAGPGAGAGAVLRLPDIRHCLLYTSAWINSQGFTNLETRPYVKKGGWEALIANEHYADKNAIDFWRIEPTGRFYVLRTFEDDTAFSLLNRNGKPGELLDFLLLISRTAEILGTGKAFAEAFGANLKNTKLEFAFRLTGLKGRTICCWVEPGRRIIQSVKAEDSEVISKCSIPLEIPQSALWQSVKTITQPVFDIFGSGVGDSIIEEITNNTLNRSL